MLEPRACSPTITHAARMRIAYAGRRLWQEHHAHFLPTDNIEDFSDTFPKFIAEKNGAECPSLPVWQALCGAELPACLTQVIKDLLKLYLFTAVCDPPMKFQSSDVGLRMPFDPDKAAPVDDKIKPGKPCFVLCPALHSVDGLQKAKAMVLAADYL